MNTLQRDKLIYLPKKSGDHNCFGCGPGNDAGLKMEFYTNRDRSSVYAWLTIPDHVCGWGSVVHGGIVTTILDEAMGWAAATLTRQPPRCSVEVARAHAPVVNEPPPTKLCRRGVTAV